MRLGSSYLDLIVGELCWNKGVYCLVGFVGLWRCGDVLGCLLVKTQLSICVIRFFMGFDFLFLPPFLGHKRLAGLRTVEIFIQ